VYLLQTRLQKMPYKHIAAHLKKTELACRLHYHQLSHGSNRRKRTTSVSSGSSASHSPILPASIPSPIHEAASGRSNTPPSSAGSYGSASPPVQLPSIMGSTSNTSPRLPTILPKPAAMTLPQPSASPRGYPTPIPEPPHSAALPSATFPPHSAHSVSGHSSNPPLRLDCSALPPPTSSHHHAHIDMTRLQAVYNGHRATFWAAVAADYGNGANPAVLEQAWKSGICCGQQHTPITPIASPDNADRDFNGKCQGQGQDKTRIAAILGIDANPRSPREREMVRRIEEERGVVPPSA
jgi:hypothetical protein